MYRQKTAVQLLQILHLEPGLEKKFCQHLRLQRHSPTDLVQVWKCSKVSAWDAQHFDAINTIEHLRWVYNSNHARTTVTNLTAIEEDGICAVDRDGKWPRLWTSGQPEISDCLVVELCTLTVSVTKPE